MHALIMAGGSGKRFWPMSRAKSPKQFLNLFGETSMIQMTYERLMPLVKPENILVITNKDQKTLATQHLPELPIDNIIGEPLSRNTAPCIGLGAMLAARKATGFPPNPALVLGALGLAHTGMYKAIKKGERAAGVKKDKGTTVPRYIGRSAFGQIVPIAGDYIVREGTQYK